MQPYIQGLSKHMSTSRPRPMLCVWTGHATCLQALRPLAIGRKNKAICLISSLMCALGMPVHTQQREGGREGGRERERESFIRKQCWKRYVCVCVCEREREREERRRRRRRLTTCVSRQPSVRWLRSTLLYSSSTVARRDRGESPSGT